MKIIYILKCIKQVSFDKWLLLLVVLLVLLACIAFAVLLKNEAQRQSGETTLKGLVSAKEFDQLIKHFEAHARRQMRIERCLPLDDPNCDPNNYPLSPRIAKLSLAGKKHLCAIAILIKKGENVPLDDPNGERTTFFILSNARILSDQNSIEWKVIED